MGRDFLRQSGAVLLLALGVSAALAWPAHAWEGAAGLAALGLAAGVTLVGAVAGRLVLVALRKLDTAPDAGPRALQAGMAARLLATMALTLPVVVLRPVPGVAFVAFLGAHYAAQLVLELFVSLRELGQNHGPREPGAGRPGAGPAASLHAGDARSDDGDAPGARDR